MREYIEIGPAPCRETPAEVGEPEYRTNALRECLAYIQAIRNYLGPEPDGAHLDTKAFDHDFGRYYEVVCDYDPNRPEAVDYAFRCERRAGDVGRRWSPTAAQDRRPEALPMTSPAVALVVLGRAETAGAGQALIEAVRTVLGPEPGGAALDLQESAAGGRRGCDIVCHYDRDIPGSAEYAFHCRRAIAQIQQERGRGPTR